MAVTSTFFNMAAMTNMAALPHAAFGYTDAIRLDNVLGASLDAKLGRQLSETPRNLSRVVYIPRHEDSTAHLPIYDVTKTYFNVVKSEPIGSSNYKLKLAMMKRPTGDRMDDEVRYLVDFQGGIQASRATVERRVPTHDGDMISMSLPRERDCSFQVEPLNSGEEYRLVLTSSYPVKDSRIAERPIRHPWFAISHQTKDGTETLSCILEWQICPRDHGPLRYTLVECGTTSPGNEPVVHAIYHHVGIGLELPHDYSEGVLLLSEDLTGEAEALAVTTLLGLLRQVRRVNQPGPGTRKKSLSLVKKVLGKT